MRLQVQKHARHAAALELLGQLGNRGAEVAEDRFIAAMAGAGRHEVFERLLIDLRLPLAGLWVAIVLDVHPAQSGLHRDVLFENFAQRVALANDVAGVEDQHHGRVADLAMNFGQQVPRLADQVGFDLNAKGQVRPHAGVHDLTQPIHHLRYVFPGIAAPGRVEREAADELGLEGEGHVAGFFNVLLQIFFEGHVGVGGAIVAVFELDLADRRADRGDVQAVLVFQAADVLNLGPAELHYVFHAAAGIDEP